MEIQPSKKIGRIYKIWSPITDKVYIGATTQSLQQRLSDHKSDYKKFKEGKRRKVASFDLFDEFGVENFQIELLQEEWIEKLNSCNLRKAIPFDRKEYHEMNREHEKEYKIGYHERNKEKRNLQSQTYHQRNKDRISERKRLYYQQTKDVTKEEKNARNRDYYNQNREKILSQKKLYQQEHKSLIATKRKAHRESMIELK
jgi:hypothetical protein